MLRHVRRAVTTAAAVLALGSSFATADADAPSPPTITCDPTTVDVPRDGTYAGTVRCRSSDGSAITGYAVETDPSLGDLIFDRVTGAFRFTPNSGVTELDAFSFRASGASATSDETYMMLDIKNFAPVCAVAATVSTPHDRTLRLTPTCTDANGDTITVTAAGTPPAHGTLGVLAHTLTYTPSRGYVGPDAVAFQSSDGEVTNDPVTVTLSVVNSAPRCTAAPYSVVHDRPRLVSVTCTDADGDRMTLTSSAARHGTVLRTGPTQFRFTPAAHFVGAGSFAVTARDGLSAGPALAVRVRVTNQAPRLVTPARISARGAKTFRVATSDRDRDPVRVRVASRPRHGSVTVVGTAVTYRPRAGYRGRDSFALRASDGVGASATRRVAVTVTRR